MPDPQQALETAFRGALVAAFGPDVAGTDPAVRPATNPRFGDYQANAAMALAKTLGRRPRDVAEDLVAHLEVAGLCSAVEVAGPGFVNLTLDDRWVARGVGSLLRDERSGVPPSPSPETVVIDYSSPNVAREMHIGHLRTTVIGDTLARVLGFLGHRVIRQNHLGDWGTQFGMLIEHLVDTGWAASDDHQVSDLNELYQAAQARFSSDADFADRARRRVVALQSGDPTTSALWRALVAESERHFRLVYDRLGVLLRDDDIRGESFYNDQLDAVASELEARGLARMDDGALCAFPAGFEGREGEPLPLIVRKSDGAYGYQATDLAALRFRTTVLGAERIVYVVDARQAQHFAMVFAVARDAGWLTGSDRVEHVAFGTVMGADGRPFRTRSGENVKLIELLDEAELRAAAIVAAKNPGLTADQRAQVARAVGIASVKYADLANDRIKDYTFDWDRMLSFDGNTAAYLLNAYVRIRSIFRRSEVAVDVGDSDAVRLVEPAERALALVLLQMPGVVAATAESLQPHRLCTYLFDVAQTFTTFYEACPVLRAETEELRRSRLVLCEVAAGVLQTGLDLLGIQTVDQM